MLWAEPPVRWLAQVVADRPPLRSALRIGLIYTALGAVWIAFSDRALELWIADPAQLTAWQTYKGWAFVLASGALIGVLVRREVGRTRATEAHVRDVVEQNLVGVYVVREGRFLYVNPRFAEIFGYGRDEMIRSVRVEDIVAPDDLELVLENLRRREEAETDAIRYRFRGRRKDGEELHLEVFGRRTELRDGPAIIGVLLDRTEQRELEEHLRRARRMEAIGQLTGAVAHDFNNLLTAIITPLELCLQEMDERTEFRDEIAEVRETAERAAALTRQLLAFSRRQLDRPAVLDPDEALRRLAPMLERLLPGRITLRVEAGGAEGNVRIDPSALEQVIVNLAVNARDAMPDGGELVLRTREVDELPEPLVELGGASPGPFVCLEVRDTGDGMEPETKRRVFEPFFTTKEEGTGLGLATVFGLTKKAGGAIDVETAPGEGTTFRVYLPAVDEPAESVGGEPVASAVDRGGKRRRILVVEDDDRVRAVTTTALERFGYEVFAAGGTEAALEFAERPQGRIDLLLTDVMLADGRGPELSADYLERRPGTKVLFVSGYSDEEALGEVQRMRGARFLEKPFSLDALAEKVEEALTAPAPEVGRQEA